MVYRRSAVFQVSRNLVDSFIFHTIENGALTAVCAALNLIFYLVYPDNYLFICVELILGRLCVARPPSPPTYSSSYSDTLTSYWPL